MSAEPRDLFPAGASAPAGERSEDDAARGFLRVRIGQHPVRRIPTLKRKYSDAWAAHAAKHIVGIRLDDASDPNAFVASLATVAGQAIFDLVVMYDRTNALSGLATAKENRAWVEEEADDRDLWEALEAMATATFPFAKDPRVHSVVAAFGPQIRFVIGLALGSLAARLAPEEAAEPSPSPSSSNGSPTATDGIPTPSTSGSATSSSSSSGGTARNGSSGKRSTRPR